MAQPASKCEAPMKQAVAGHSACKCGLAKGHDGECRPTHAAIRSQYKVGPQARQEGAAR